MMSEKTDLDFLQTHLAAMNNCTLYKIVVGLYYVDIVFGGDIHTIVRIKKKINFVIDGTSGSFDWKDEEISATGSCEFIKFVGMHCQYVRLDQSYLEMKFTEGGSVSISIGKDDFEPLEFIGTSGPHGEKLEFYIVM